MVWYRRSVPSVYLLLAEFLPYCDAMFVDAEMAGFLGEEPLRTEVRRYETNVFSVNTKTDFLAYLDSLEEDAGEGHARIVSGLYGEGWAEPYLGLVQEHIRRRNERGQ